MLNFFVFLFLQSTLIPVFKFKRSALLDVWKIERTESLLWFCVGVEFMDWIHQDLPKTSRKIIGFFFQFVYVSGILLFNEILNYELCELWTLYLLELVFSKFKIFNNTLILWQTCIHICVCACSFLAIRIFPSFS